MWKLRVVHLSRFCCALSLAVLLGTATRVDAEVLRAGGTGSAIGTVRALGVALAKQDGSFKLALAANLGSSGGLRALQGGAIDIALISRPLKPEESAAGLVAFEFGRSPFILVTCKTDVKSLSVRETADFLSGRVQTWPDGSPVRIVLRPKTDGDNEVIASISPLIADALQRAQRRPGMVVAPTDQDAADEAERLTGSLAFNTLALLISERRRLNIIALDGVMPSVGALADGSYPHYKSLFIVTRGAPTGVALRFVDFIKSSRGRALLEANGLLVLR